MNPALQAAIAAAMKNKEAQEAVNVSGGACLMILLVLASVGASAIALLRYVIL